MGPSCCCLQRSWGPPPSHPAPMHPQGPQSALRKPRLEGPVGRCPSGGWEPRLGVGGINQCAFPAWAPAVSFSYGLWKETVTHCLNLPRGPHHEAMGSYGGRGRAPGAGLLSAGRSSRAAAPIFLCEALGLRTSSCGHRNGLARQACHACPDSDTEPQKAITSQSRDGLQTPRPTHLYKKGHPPSPTRLSSLCGRSSLVPPPSRPRLPRHETPWGPSRVPADCWHPQGTRGGPWGRRPAPPGEGE